MKQTTELRKQFQEIQESKERQKSKIKRSILRSEQDKIRNKFLTLYNES